MHQHHSIILGVRKLGEDFRMAGVVKAGQINGLLLMGPVTVA